MPLSPAQRHQRRVLAEQQAAGRAAGQPMAGASAYEQQMAALHGDYLRLKGIQSNEGKAALKRELVPAYLPYITGVLAADSGAQDEVVTTLMVWAIDAGLYADALPIAAYVIKHGLTMSDRFSRTPACIVAEEIAEAATGPQRANTPFGQLDVLLTTEAITADQDMPDEVRAKLQVAIARERLLQLDRDAPDRTIVSDAVARFERALQLHPQCGARKECERANSLLKKITGTATDASASTAAEPGDKPGPATPPATPAGG